MQQIIVPIGIDKPLESCNSFVLLPKANGKTCFCLDWVRLNKTLFRSAQWGLTLNAILP